MNSLTITFCDTDKLNNVVVVDGQVLIPTYNNFGNKVYTITTDNPVAHLQVGTIHQVQGKNWLGWSLLWHVLGAGLFAPISNKKGLEMQVDCTIPTMQGDIRMSTNILPKKLKDGTVTQAVSFNNDNVVANENKFAVNKQAKRRQLFRCLLKVITVVIVAVIAIIKNK